MRFVANLLAVVCCTLGLWAATPAARAATPQEDCASAQNPDDAIRACNEVISRNPRDAVAYSNRGVAYAQKGDLDTAIRDLNQAIGINPRATTALIERGVAYGRKGDRDRGILDFNRAIQIGAVRDPAGLKAAACCAVEARTGPRRPQECGVAESGPAHPGWQLRCCRRHRPPA